MTSYLNYHTSPAKNASSGVFLVSDGGFTYSSINTPTINANNANAPADVPAPFLLSLVALAFTFRRKTHKVTQ
jgi:hypothetical protein